MRPMTSEERCGVIMFVLWPLTALLDGMTGMIVL